MKTKLLLLFLLIFTKNLFAQNDIVYIVEEPRNLFWGDSQYSNNLKGIKYLMDDLEKADQYLFDDMRPSYEALLRQNTEANIIMGVGSAATIGILLVGVKEGIPRRNNTLPVSSIVSPNDPQSQFKSSAKYIAVGGILGVATSFLYYKKRVKQEDVFQFMNEFNRNTTGDKLELGLRPEIGIGDGGTLGLAFSLKF